MKYFLVVVLIALGALAFLQVNKYQKTDASNIFEEYPYPSSGKLLEEGIRPALMEGDTQKIKDLTVAGAQSDVEAFMNEFNASTNAQNREMVEFEPVMEEDENGESESMKVVVNDSAGNTVFQGTLEISNPEHNLRYRIIGATTGE